MSLIALDKSAAHAAEFSPRLEPAHAACAASAAGRREGRGTLRALACALALGACLGWAGAAAQSKPAAAEPTAAMALATASARYDAARDQYEIGHFTVAFAAFAQLADEGHCEAARIARGMVRHGRELYATEFAVAPERLTRWQRLPGCPVALASR